MIAGVGDKRREDDGGNQGELDMHVRVKFEFFSRTNTYLLLALLLNVQLRLLLPVRFLLVARQNNLPASSTTIIYQRCRSWNQG